VASRFLTEDEQAQVGVQKPFADPITEAEIDNAPAVPELPEVASAPGAGNGSAANGGSNGKANGHAVGQAEPAADVFRFRLQEDAPPCHECGSIMVRGGACYKCLNCGATSGCS